MISAKVCRWLSVRGRTYRTLITPEVSVAAAQEVHTMSLIWGRYLTKKLLLQHLPLNPVESGKNRPSRMAQKRFCWPGEGSTSWGAPQAAGGRAASSLPVVA